MTSYFSLLPPDLLNYVKKTVGRCVCLMRYKSYREAHSTPRTRAVNRTDMFDYATSDCDQMFTCQRAHFEYTSWTHLCGVMGADSSFTPRFLNEGFWAFVEQKPAPPVRLDPPLSQELFPNARIQIQNPVVLFDGALATTPEPEYTRLLKQHYAALLADVNKKN
jgi:hypothetical protein